MFTKRTIKPHQAVAVVDTASEALAVSISEKACVDMSYMSQLTGKTKEELARELQGVIFRVPGQLEQDGTPHYVTADEYLSGNVRRKLRQAQRAAQQDKTKEELARELQGVIFRVPGQLEKDGTPHYVTADEYLSGNVRRKLRQAQRAAQQDPSFAVNVEALTAAQPKDLDASEIEVRLGATWIDKEYIQQFMYETFNTPFYLQRSIEVKCGSPYRRPAQRPGCVGDRGAPGCHLDRQRVHPAVYVRDLQHSVLSPAQYRGQLFVLYC